MVQNSPEETKNSPPLKINVSRNFISWLSQENISLGFYQLINNLQ